METEKVTFSAGVPTVWQMLLTYIQANNLKFSTLKRVTIGGSACSPSMMKTLNDYGVTVLHIWVSLVKVHFGIFRTDMWPLL
jgi:fatty-acyl-CoA synthase